jgi:serine/threonine-protein kinase
MAFATGSRIGHYEVVGLLGAGGMGEVYRARDMKLGREVALKFVLEAFTGDHERLARFEREARALAALNHPGIATLHGLEQAPSAGSSSPVHFLVMELVEGETLDQVLGAAGRTGPLPLERTIAIARQIAEALEVAHERGIIHRDLKPANIKITPDDKVKVLDFGLAKALDGAGGASRLGGDDAQNSPTMSAIATARGVILGTAAYMSPEQARGAPADHRSDVFSFGIVFYEMLTGRHPFPGETVSDVLASVLACEPDHSALPADLAPRLVDLVRRCLEKHPRKRWQAIGDVRYELEQSAAAPRATTPLAPPAVTPAPRPLWKRALPAAIAAILASAITAGALWRLQPVRSPAIVTRFPVAFAEGQMLTGIDRPVLAVSPDGATLAYVASAQVFVRSMSDVESRPIKGTRGVNESPASLTFSPDGRSIAYFQAGQIKTVEIAGAAPVVICDADNPLGMSWSGDTILFANPAGIMRVASSGGQPELVIPMTGGDTPSRPQLLPGGRAVLFTVAAAGNAERWDTARVVVRALDTGAHTTLLEGGFDARFVASTPGALDHGHLVYAVQGIVYARPFDVSRLAITGGAVSVIEGVRRGVFGGVSHFGLSDTGTLAYLPGPATISGAMNLQIVLIDRAGVTQALNVPPGPHSVPRMSPDGRTIAFGRAEARDTSIWVQDTSGGGSSRRLTFGANDRVPVWTSDSRRVVFQSNREGDLALFWQRADGTGTAERLTKPVKNEAHVALSASPDGAVLLVDRTVDARTTLVALSLEDRTMTAFGGVESDTPTGAVFSPDGKWVAYSSRDAAQSSAVYVQPFPATGAKFQISPAVEDGHHPVWSADGRELLYNPGPGGRLAAVAVSTAKGFGVGPAPPFSAIVFNQPPSAQRPYDTARDGKLIVAMRPADQSSASTLRVDVVLNWFEELRARAPVP